MRFFGYYIDTSYELHISIALAVCSLLNVFYAITLMNRPNQRHYYYKLRNKNEIKRDEIG